MLETWDYPEDYVQRVRAASSAEDVMALLSESMEHGDWLAYTRARHQVLQEDTEERFKATPPQSLTWEDAMGPLIFESGNLLPWLYHTAHEFDVLKHDERAKGLTWAWTDAEWPEQYLDTDYWLEYFNEVGFVQDHEVVAKPTEPLVLWRGATESRWDGMAWTERPEVANWFAKRWIGLKESEPVKVFKITVYPDDVVAHFTGRGEAEWLVDAYALSDMPMEEFDVDELPEFKRPVHVRNENGILQWAKEEEES